MTVSWPVGESYFGEHERVNDAAEVDLWAADEAVAKAVDDACADVEREVAGCTIDDIDQLDAATDTAEGPSSGDLDPYEIHGDLGNELDVPWTSTTLAAAVEEARAAQTPPPDSSTYDGADGRWWVDEDGDDVDDLNTDEW